MAAPELKHKNVKLHNKIEKEQKTCLKKNCSTPLHVSSIVQITLCRDGLETPTIYLWGLPVPHLRYNTGRNLSDKAPFTCFLPLSGHLVNGIPTYIKAEPQETIGQAQCTFVLFPGGMRFMCQTQKCSLPIGQDYVCPIVSYGSMVRIAFQGISMDTCDGRQEMGPMVNFSCLILLLSSR